MKLLSKIQTSFPALKYRDYRLYFFGQLISFTGSWLQGVAHGWLVYGLTHSPFWLGVVSAVSALPVLLFSLYGGILVDKYNRKKLLILTQSAALVFAFLLGILTITHVINIFLLLVLTLFSGIANAIDNPVTQAFVVDIVGKKDLPSAVGLNSLLFNTGRVLGPAAAGFFIALVGVGNIFLINAASFLAILVSLFLMKGKTQMKTPPSEKSLTQMKEGFMYAYTHPVIRLLLCTAAIGALFSFSQTTIMPVVAEKIFTHGVHALGDLLSAMGFGALIGSFLISSQSKKIKSVYFIITGNIVFVVSMLFFSFTKNLSLALFWMFFSGFGITIQFSTIYALLQQLVQEEFRGRISSIYVFLFIGLSPLGNLFMGSVTTFLGPQLAIRFCLAAVILYSALLAIHLPYAKKQYAKYKITRLGISPIPANQQ